MEMFPYLSHLSEFQYANRKRRPHDFTLVGVQYCTVLYKVLYSTYSTVQYSAEP